MANVILMQASPRNATTGVTTAVRLAGGGSKAYNQLGFVDWRAGIATTVPRFTTAIGFDQVGQTGGALAQTAALRFFGSDKALLSTLANLYWQGAAVTISTGDDEAAAPAYTAILTGTVDSIKVADGAIVFTIRDLSADLDKPVLPDKFGGTGDLDGGSYAAGRVKRRTWGVVFNVEGFVLDSANNIYEFGDPLRPINSFVAVKDKGRAGVAPVTVAWAGTALATLNALRAASPPAGGAAIAPSIACVKWWTVPAGPLTADLQGEIGAGYVNTAPAIAARIVSVYSASITISNLATALTWQSATAGIHLDDAGVTVGQALDKLLLPVSIAWILDGSGAMIFRRLTWTGPVEAIASISVARDAVFQPLKTRHVGYQKNYRIHTDGEISAAIIEDDIVSALAPQNWTYANGATFINLGGTDRPASQAAVSMTTTNAKVFWRTRYSVQPGETLFFQHTVEALASVTTGTDNVRGGLATYDSLGAFIANIDIPLSAVAASLGTGTWWTLSSPIQIPANVFSVQPFSIRTVASAGTMYAAEPYLGRSQPGADVTSVNQHTFAAIADILVAASAVGVVATGALPQTRLAPRLLGDVDVSTATNYVVSISGGTAYTLNNTPGDIQRGLITITNAAIPLETIVTVTSTYLGIDLTQTFRVLRQDAPPAGGGGGGGGGSPGSPASIYAFTPPGTNAVYVTMGTIAAVTTGSAGTLTFAAGISYYSASQGSIDPSIDPIDDNQMQVVGEYSTNGGSTWTAAGSSATGSGAEHYFSYVVPKGTTNSPGYVSFSYNITGLGSGTSVLCRVRGLNATGLDSINSASGFATATPT